MGFEKLGTIATLAAALSVSGCNDSRTSKNTPPSDEIADAFIKLDDMEGLPDNDQDAQEPDIYVWEETPDGGQDSTREDSSVNDAGTDASTIQPPDATIVRPDAGEQVDVGVPEVTGRITVSRCDLGHNNLPAGIIDAAPNRESYMVNMQEVANRAQNGQPTQISSGCFVLTGQFEPAGATAELNVLNAYLYGDFIELPTHVTWGDAVEAPFSPRFSYDSLQPTGGVVQLQDGVPLEVHITHELGTSNHADDFFVQPSLIVDAGRNIGVDCNDCGAPTTTFNNSNKYWLTTNYTNNDDDAEMLIGRGDLTDGGNLQGTLAGSWNLRGRNGAYGTLNTFDVSCTDELGEFFAPITGHVDIEVMDNQYRTVQIVQGASVINGIGQLADLGIATYPGDSLDIRITATDLAVPDDAEMRLHCAPTNISYAEPTSTIVANVENRPEVDWQMNDNHWNMLGTDVPPNRLGESDVDVICFWSGQRQPLAYDFQSNYLWEGNLDYLFWIDDNGIEHSDIAPLPDTNIFGLVCYNRGGVGQVSHFSLAVNPTDFEVPYDFNTNLVVDGANIDRQNLRISAADNGSTIEVDVNLDPPMPMVSALVLSVNPTPQAVNFPQNDPQTPPYFFIERPNLTADLKAMDFVDVNGAPGTVVFNTLVQSDGEVDGAGNPIFDFEEINMDLVESGNAVTKPNKVEFATPWTFMTETSGGRPIVADPLSPETLADGIRVLNIQLQNYYAGGKLVGLTCSHTSGKAELGNTIVEIKVNNNSVFVPPERWNDRTFSVELDPATFVRIADGYAGTTNDLDRATGYTNVEVIIRGDFDGFSRNGFNVGLVDMQVVAGSMNQPVAMGTSIDDTGTLLTPVDWDNPLTGPRIVLQPRQ